MIVDQLLNGKSLIGDNKCFLLKMSGFASPNIEHTSYARGGRQGAVVAQPLYRNFDLLLEYQILGKSPGDFIANRDDFIGLWGLNPIDGRELTLTTVLSDGSVRKAFVRQKSVLSDLSAENHNSCIVQIGLNTTKEYFQSENSEISISANSNSGGMPLPMPIPMSMQVDHEEVISGTIFNRGNSYAYPEIKVYGPCRGFSLSCHQKGSTYLLSSSVELDDGQYLYLDFYNQVASINRVKNVLSTMSGVWWSNAPGNSVVQLHAAYPNTNTRAVIEHHSAYLNI